MEGLHVCIAVYYGYKQNKCVCECVWLSLSLYIHYILPTYVNYTPCYYLVIVCLCACVCTLRLLHIDFVYILISYTKMCT